MADDAIDILLRLQDELSPALLKAQAAIKDSAAALAGVNTASAQSFREQKGASDDLGASWVARIAEGLLLRDAINEILSKAKELALGIPEEAHALNLLSLQTQINVEDLQVLSAATREYGVDGDQLGRALFQLGRRIAGGDESVATAYHLMGMSLEQVRGMNAMDLFLATERGLGTLEGTIRDTAAADLYGGKLGVSMGAFSTGVDEAMDKARALNTIASTESVKALAEYQDQIDRATHSLHAWVMELEGPAAQGINTLTDAVGKGASKWEIFKAMVQDALLTQTLGHTVTTNLATVLDDLNKKTEQNTKATGDQKKAHQEVAVALDAHGQAAKFMAALELDAAKPLLAWQEDYLQHLKDIGELDAKHAAGIGVTADQLKQWTKQTDAASASTEALYAETLKYDELLAHMDKETFTLAMEHEKVWREEQAKATQRSNAAILAEFEAQRTLNAEWGLNAAGAIRVQGGALDVLNQKLTELHANKVEGISQAKEEQVLLDEYTKALYDDAVAQDTVAASTVKIGAASDSASDKFKSFTGTLVLGVKDLDDVNAALSKFYDELDKGGGIGTMGGANGIGVVGPGGPSGMRVAGQGLPTRDAGGPVMAGQPYYVGTGAQPELFIPSTSGTMVPNGAGGTTVNLGGVYVTQPFGTPDAIATATLAAVTARLRQMGVRF